MPPENTLIFHETEVSPSTKRHQKTFSNHTPFHMNRINKINNDISVLVYSTSQKIQNCVMKSGYLLEHQLFIMLT